MKTLHKKRSRVRFVTQAALIAALYVALTYLSYAMGLSGGVIQVRFSEALCVLALFTPAAIPGVTIGCVLANLLTNANIFDVIFGSFASFLGVLGGFLIHLLLKKGVLMALLSTLPTILSNMLIVPLILRYAYGAPDAYFFMVCTVGAGELISAGILGMMLYFALRKKASVIFKA